MSCKKQRKRAGTRKRKKSSISRAVVPPLNPTEAQIYTLMITEGVYATSSLSARLKKTERYINKCKKRLVEIGLWNGRIPPRKDHPPGDPGTPGTRKPKIRLHAQKFRIEIVRMGDRFRPGLVLDMDGNNVQTFSSVLCVQSRQYFYGSSEDEALSASMVYFERLFLRLEHELDVILLKHRRQNIEMTYAEWATEDSDLAETAYRKSKRIRIYTADGRLRFSVDKSKGYEHEAHLPPRDGGMEDSRAGNHHIEAFLDNPDCPTLPELAQICRDIASGLHAVVELQRPPEPPDRLEVPGRPWYVG